MYVLKFFLVETDMFKMFQRKFGCYMFYLYIDYLSIYYYQSDIRQNPEIDHSRRPLLIKTSQ